jgi:hypothetical protein
MPLPCSPPQRRRTGRPWLLAAGAAAVVLQTGCALQPPAAWEKGILAKPEMTMEADPLDRRFSQHIYTSKEAASGGTGVGGGGCGCN